MGATKRAFFCRRVVQNIAIFTRVSAIKTQIHMLLVLFAASPLVASADTVIYKKVDRYGNVTYTDVPPRAEEQAETIDIDGLNSYSPPAEELECERR